MTVQERRILSAEVRRIRRLVVRNLLLVFGEISKDWPIVVQWCDEEDMPWLIRIGYTEDECVEVRGFDVPMLTIRWQQWGVSEVRKLMIGVES